MYNNLKKDDADISICKHIVLFDNNTQISTATHKKYILNPKDTLEMLLYDEDMDVSAVRSSSLITLSLNRFIA